MFTLASFRRDSDRAFTRRPRACRPFVEGFESRQLLSAVALVQGGHIGTSVVEPSLSLNFTKIEYTAMIQGGHIGTSVSANIVGQHIGTNIVGQHIG